MKIDSSMSGYMYGNIKDTYLNDNRVNARNIETEVSSASPSTVVHLSDRLKNYLSANPMDSSADVQEVNDTGNAKSSGVVSSELQDRIARIEADPAYAEHCAKSETELPDVQFFYFKDRLARENADPNYYAPGGAYEQERNSFSRTANEALVHRKAIYNEMKAQGASGKDIYYTIVKYNNTLPDSYKNQTGKAAMWNAIANRERA